MKDIEALLAANPPAVEAAVTVTPSRAKCKRHTWVRVQRDMGYGLSAVDECDLCGTVKDHVRSKRNRNNGKRGRAAELTAARHVGGRKVGPLGFPWDVEMTGYARLQVRKYARPESVRAIAAELARIARAPGAEMPGYIWIEPGRDGESLIVFRLKDFAERHGVPTGDEP